MAWNTVEFAFYYSHGCELCADAEAAVQAHVEEYDRILVEATEDPARVKLSMGEGMNVRCARSAVPAVPALLDRREQALFVGVDAIWKHLSSMT